MLSGKTTNIFIFVEGQSDVDLYQKFMNNDNTVQVLMSEGGKQCVINTVQSFDNDQVIGITDSDFDVFLQKEAYKRIYRTDFHDLELMMINSDAWVSVFQEYYHGKDSAEELKQIILAALEPISNGKLINYIEVAKLRFDAIRLCPYYNAKDCTLDLDRFIEDLNIRSPKKKRMLKRQECDNLINNEELSDNDKIVLPERGTEYLFQLCSGHDFIELFAHIARDRHTHWQPPTAEQISRALRASYCFEAFSKTKLYFKLRDYAEGKNKPILIA